MKMDMHLLLSREEAIEVAGIGARSNLKVSYLGKSLF